jgi:glycosyltransferase involved in cell wall biosynthesis
LGSLTGFNTFTAIFQLPVPTMIQYVAQPASGPKPIFSVLIPTWNNLPFLRLCVASIRKNSTVPLQIVLHLNEGNDGSLEWAKAEGLAFSHSTTNVGICYGCNAAYSLAQADYIVYLNDDMYACPGWDTELYAAIQAYGKDDFYFSGTMIERGQSGYGCVSAPHDFGGDVATFREADLLQALPSLSIPDWQGATYPPSVMHRRMWDLIGGFSIEFTPGMYSDPDISMKLWHAGCRNYRGIGTSLVYHFGSKSIGRVKHNRGKKQFLRKWGIPPSLLYNHYVRLYNHDRDAHYQGILTEPGPAPAYRWASFLGKVKAWLA